MVSRVIACCIHGKTYILLENPLPPQVTVILQQGAGRILVPALDPSKRGTSSIPKENRVSNWKFLSSQEHHQPSWMKIKWWMLEIMRPTQTMYKGFGT